MRILPQNIIEVNTIASAIVMKLNTKCFWLTLGMKSKTINTKHKQVPMIE